MGDWARIALDAMPDPVVVLEAVRRDDGAVVDFVYRFANEAACTYNDTPHDALIGSTLLHLFPGMIGTGLLAANVEAVESGRSFRLRDQPYVNERRKEELRYDVLAVPRDDVLVVVWRDVTDRWLTQNRLRDEAFRDSLTGLLSRAEGLRRLHDALAVTPRRGEELAVAYLDIDGLKQVNDRHGHAAGDDLLSTAALRIRSCVRGDDLVVRLGGDEILVVLRGVASLDAAKAVCEKMRLALSARLIVGDADLTTTMSIGVTLARAGEPAETVIARADAAMYDAKRAGGDRVAARLPVEDGPSGTGRSPSVGRVGLEPTT